MESFSNYSSAYSMLVLGDSVNGVSKRNKYKSSFYTTIHRHTAQASPSRASGPHLPSKHLSVSLSRSSRCELMTYDGSSVQNNMVIPGTIQKLSAPSASKLEQAWLHVPASRLMELISIGPEQRQSWVCNPPSYSPTAPRMRTSQPHFPEASCLIPVPPHTAVCRTTGIQDRLGSSRSVS
jgi:hypothetical protein